MRLTLFTYNEAQVARAPGRAFHTAHLAEEFELSRNHPARTIRCLAWADPNETRCGGCGAALVWPASEVGLDTNGCCCTLE